MGIKLNSISFVPAGYCLPALPRSPHGPDVLIDAVVHGRNFSRAIHDGDSEWLAPLTDAGLERLVNLAYYTSLMPEEGRFSRFKLVCQDARGSVFTVGRIEPVALEDVDSLRRLAPICASPDCSLLVSERDGRLFCEGVVNVGGMGYPTIPGRPGVVGIGTTPTFAIEVFGPSHLRAGEHTAPSYELRAGKVRPLCPYLVRNVTARLHDAVRARISRDVLPAIGGDFSHVVNDERPILHVLSTVLRRAAGGGHGGAFIFLPPELSVPELCGLKVPYRTTEIDLGDDIVKQWHAFGDVARSNEKQDYERSIRVAEIRRAKTLTDCEAVASFSAIDGCVVLTYDLRVVGFGAKITVSERDSQSSPRRFKHIASDTVYHDDEFMCSIGGTRHQSVARLCQAHAGTLTYTLSQDGELKLFYSDPEFAYVFGPLDLPTIDSEVFVS